MREISNPTFALIDSVSSSVMSLVSRALTSSSHQQNPQQFDRMIANTTGLTELWPKHCNAIPTFPQSCFPLCTHLCLLLLLFHTGYEGEYTSFYQSKHPLVHLLTLKSVK